MKKLFFCIGFFLYHTVHAQTVTGYWYGQANVEMAGLHNNYLTELIIAQKGTHVKGFFGYYFKDTYQSFLVRGTYDPATRKIVIRDIPIIYFNTNSTINSVECITSFYGTLLVSKVKSTLTGYFYRDKKYTYTCPDLRVNYTLYTEEQLKDSSLKDMVAIKRTWKPHDNNYVFDENSVAKVKKEKEAKAVPEAKLKEPKKEKEETDNSTQAATAASAPANGSAETKPDATDTKSGSVAMKPDTSETKSIAAETKPDITETKSDAVPAKQNAAAETKPEDPVQKDMLAISEKFKKRKQILGRVLEVSSDSVRLSFYDNAEVDGDSISVFINRQLVLAHQELSERAFNLYVKLDSLKEINEVSMFAENLGKYPPNTALMVVNDGDKRYEVFMSSDFNGNATIQLKRKRSF